MNIDWMEVGKEYNKDSDQRKQIIKEIEQADWKELATQSSLPMGQGMAIQKAIKEFRIPKVSHISIFGMLSGYGFYGIRGHYKQGDLDLFLLDTGCEVTPICTVKHWEAQ